MTSPKKINVNEELLSIEPLSREELERPRHAVMPRKLWTETVPNLWQG